MKIRQKYWKIKCLLLENRTYPELIPVLWVCQRVLHAQDSLDLRVYDVYDMCMNINSLPAPLHVNMSKVSVTGNRLVFKLQHGLYCNKAERTCNVVTRFRAKTRTSGDERLSLWRSNLRTERSSRSSRERRGGEVGRGVPSLGYYPDVDVMLLLCGR